MGSRGLFLASQPRLFSVLFGPDIMVERRMVKVTKNFCALKVALLALAVLPFSTRSKADEVRTNLRLDPEHRFTIHYEFYPPESVRAHEQGKCLVAVFVDRSGVVRASQLRQSTGFPRLDAACLISVKGQRMLPATLNGKPVGAWTTIPIVWGSIGNAHVPLVEDSVPMFPKDYELQVGPAYYPAEARERKEQGVCLIYASVSPDGEVAESKVLKSTGSTSLDRACTDALTLAQFIPARKDGVAVRAGALLALFWVQ
jgi:TonB family protein